MFPTIISINNMNEVVENTPILSVTSRSEVSVHGWTGAKSNTSSSPNKLSLRRSYVEPLDASVAGARKRSQQEKLWDLFTTYALQISSEDPTRISSANVIRLLQDCGVIDGQSYDETKMIEKEVQIVCAAFMKTNPSDRDGAKKLTFTAFLELLKSFAKMSGEQESIRAYDSLVRTILDKIQNPRSRVSIAKEMEECEKVLMAFEEPLSKIFIHYAKLTHAKEEKYDPQTAFMSPTHIGYSECLTFARQFGLITPSVVTTTEFSSIYIDSLTRAPVTECDRVLTFSGFCELIVRIAIQAFPHKTTPHYSNERKLKALFQFMWITKTSASPRDLKMTDITKSAIFDLTKFFMLQFEKVWKKDNFENYLEDHTTNMTGSSASTIQRRKSTSSSQRRFSSTRLSLCLQPTATASSSTNDEPSPSMAPTSIFRNLFHSTSSSGGALVGQDETSSITMVPSPLTNGDNCSPPI